MPRRSRLTALALGAFLGAAATSDPCRANPTAAENCLPGVASDAWDVNGAGCPDVRAFATSSSVLPGDAVNFKAKVSPGDVLARVDVFRLGYYDGRGARKVGEATLREPSEAPACREDPATELYDCDAWPVAATWPVPTNAASGLYFARFVLKKQHKGWRADASPKQIDSQHAMEGSNPASPPDRSKPHAYGAAGKNRLRAGFRLREPRASAAFFVVRSRDTHDLLFQTADLTWHAYNGYGGLTTYGSFEYPWLHEPFGHVPLNLSDPSHIYRRAFKRSLNTPVITRDYRSVNAPFGPEIAAIRFLEKNGYDLHYATGHDLSRRDVADEILSRSRAYLSAGHDEYWTYPQREALAAARERNGLHLNFWSANQNYWAVRFEADDPRTMIIYKETQHVRKLDKPGEWTGTFRDARKINPKGPQPENALSGHMFVANAQRVDPIYLDGARFGAHRAWRNTSVASGERYYALPGTLGHEWDEPVDNGWSPPSLQFLSATTIDNVQCIQDHGATFDTGTATHHLVLHRHPTSRAWTFGAGTVQWSWALDPTHDPNDPQRANKYDIRVETDVRGPVRDLQQLTVNVLHDQGVLPATLDPALRLVDAPADEAPPTATLETASLESGVLELAGTAADLGGAVASVEVSWDPTRWHLAALDRVAADVRWSLTWGDEPWHEMHGALPAGVSLFMLRVADDSGNAREVLVQAGGGGEL